MAVTYSAPTIGATAVAALTAGTRVAFFIDGESQRSRNFIPAASDNAQYYGGSNVAIAGSGLTIAQVFPQVVTATQIADPTGGTTGPVKLVLQPGTGDTNNVASTMTYLLDQNVVVGVAASGTF